MFKNEHEVFAWLNGYLNFEKQSARAAKAPEYRLDRMAALKKICGSPDESCRICHVAGSKGKGSTATMIASILEEEKNASAVGLYTSPHIFSFTERIAINKNPVTMATLIASAEKLKTIVETLPAGSLPGTERPTYFELLTMLAFICFERGHCSDAVIEVGLGGRLDSTNVVHPALSVITPIELEHCELLGSTIAAIAGEKAGIIKHGVPVCTSAEKPDALAVIQNKARESAAPCYILSDILDIKKTFIDIHGSRALFSWHDNDIMQGAMEIHIPLIGEVQIRNAALAALSAALLGCGDTSIYVGLRKTKLHARFEVIPATPPVIIDAAHTPDSVRAAFTDFLLLFKTGVLLFGCAIDKDPETMARILRGDTSRPPVFDTVFITRPGTFKESDIQRIENAFTNAGFTCITMPQTDEAVLASKEYARGKNLPLLVTGSFYLAAEAFQRVSL